MANERFNATKTSLYLTCKRTLNISQTFGLPFPSLIPTRPGLKAVSRSANLERELAMVEEG